MNNFQRWIVICFLIRICYSCTNDAKCTKIQFSSQPEDLSLRVIRCHDWCIKQYYKEEDLSSISVYGEWPSLNISELTSNCYKYQKVKQCQLGCLTAYITPTLTVNQCRESCHSKCINTCKGKKECQLSNQPCPYKCRKPICRKGCQYSSHLSNYIPSQPLSPPVLTPSNEDYSYYISFPSIPTSVVTNTSSDWVNFLFKVHDTQDNITRYYWQTDLTLPLKLTAFACRQVQISMSVVTKSYKTNYSPVTTLCIHKEDNKMYPSQVRADMIELNYKEDTHHTSFATINVTWELPTNHQAVSSYSVYFLSRKTECGGINKLFSYEGLTQNILIVSANKDTNFPRFGCTYKMLVKVHPSLNGEDGARIDVTPKLSKITEKIKLKCSGYRISNNPMVLAINWTLPNDTMITETIENFTLMIDGHKRANIKANISQSVYLLNTIISNITDSTDNYTITLSPVKRSLYYWRPIPTSVSCQVPIPPDIPISFIVVVEHKNCSTVHLNVSWTVSSNSWSTHVQLIIGNSLTHPIHTATVSTKQNSTLLTIEVSKSDNYHIWARSLQNTTTVSSWSNPIQIQVSNHCHKENTKERLKMLERKVEDLFTSYKSIELLSKQLQRFEQKLNNITDDFMTVQ